MVRKEDCIFCKIVEGKIPCAKIYENHKYLAFLDIAPSNPGHTLVIPKDHYETLLDTPDEVLDGMLNDSKKIAKAVIKAVNTDSFNLQINIGKNSGQMVWHLHIHIIPRFPKDGHRLFSQGKYKEGEMERIASEIRKNIE